MKKTFEFNKEYPMILYRIGNSGIRERKELTITFTHCRDYDWRGIIRPHYIGDTMNPLTVWEIVMNTNGNINWRGDRNAKLLAMIDGEVFYNQGYMLDLFELIGIEL